MLLDNLKSRILNEPSEFIKYLGRLIDDYRFDDGGALEIALLIKKVNLVVYRMNNGMSF